MTISAKRWKCIYLHWDLYHNETSSIVLISQLTDTHTIVFIMIVNKSYANQINNVQTYVYLAANMQIVDDILNAQQNPHAYRSFPDKIQPKSQYCDIS